MSPLLSLEGGDGLLHAAEAVAGKTRDGARGAVALLEFLGIAQLLTSLFVLIHVLDELFKRWSYLMNGLVTDVGRNRLPLLHVPFRIGVPAPAAVVDVHFSHITTTDSQT